jgi:hypothetical protein
MDNAVRATRLGPSRIPVAVGGSDMPLLPRALGAVPGVVVRREPGEALFSVGVDERPLKAPFSVWLHSPEGRFVPQAWTIAPHALTAGLREAELGRGGVGELPAEARTGQPLFEADGKRIGVLRDGVLHLCIELNPKGWASTPSFPIFWQNVVDFASRGARAFEVVRTGRPTFVRGDVSRAPSKAMWSLSPSGQFLTYTTGEYVFRAAEGERRVEANLLDPRESDTAGVTRALDWDPAAPSGREFTKRGLAGWAAALSLVLVVLAWMMQRRSD